MIIAMTTSCLGPAAAAATFVRTIEQPNVAVGGVFGASIDLEEQTLVVGAPHPFSSSDGAAFQFDAISGVLQQTYSSDGERQFGTSVAIDGGRVLVGSPFGMDDGVARLYDAASGVLSQTYLPLLVNTQEFGAAVDLDAGTVVVGDVTTSTVSSGLATVFDANTGAFRTFRGSLSGTTGFGAAVAAGDGLIAVGSPGNNADDSLVGSVELIDLAVAPGTVLDTFFDPTPTAFDSFGYSVAIDSGRVLVGAVGDDTNASNNGQAHLFDATSGDLLWTFDNPAVSAGDVFGVSVALSGHLAVIGARGDDTFGDNVGQAYVFDVRTGDLVATLDSPTPADSQFFGAAVAIDGDLIAVSEPRDLSSGGDGRVHLFIIPEPSAVLMTLGVVVLGFRREGLRRRS